MSDTKCTPGPWKVDLNGGELEQHGVNADPADGGPWQAIATVHTGRMGGGSKAVQPGEAEANARLIAAAPEMFAVLAYMASFNPGSILGGDLCRRIKAAVAKAKGG